MKTFALLALLALTLTLAGCGGGDGGNEALEAAETHLLDAESGEFSLTLEGEREGKEVGFTVEGAFEYPGGNDTYPAVDVTYSRRQGSEDSSNQFRSDGTAAWVFNGAAVTPVGLQQLQGLRDREGVAAAVPDLEFASWFDEVEREGNTFSGTVDIGELVGDLRRLAGEIDGQQAPDTLDGDGAEQLEEALRSSSIEVEVTDDDEFRSLTVVLDFGDEIPRALDDVLVSYASAKLELRVTLAPLDGPLVVETPGSGG